MTRDAFFRRLRRKFGATLVIEPGRGKGGHAVVRLDRRWTTVQSGELSPFHIRRCCKQLGIDPDDL